MSIDLHLEKKVNELVQKMFTLENELDRIKQENNALSEKVVNLTEKFRDVSDNTLHELHSDTVLSEQQHSVIPQCDGQADSTLYQCESCHESFQSKHDADVHDEQMMYTCEECSICYPSEFDYDVHKHSMHREEYFEFNLLTPRRKRQAYESLRKLYP